MAQYLLSVHGSDTDEMPDDVQEMYAAVDSFNKEVQASGSWVFAGGLNPASTATVVDGTRNGDIRGRARGSVQALGAYAHLGRTRRQPAGLCRAPRRGRGFGLPFGQLRQLRDEADLRHCALRACAGP